MMQSNQPESGSIQICQIHANSPIHPFSEARHKICGQNSIQQAVIGLSRIIRAEATLRGITWISLAYDGSRQSWIFENPENLPAECTRLEQEDLQRVLNALNERYDAGADPVSELFCFNCEDETLGCLLLATLSPRSLLVWRQKEPLSEMVIYLAEVMKNEVIWLNRLQEAKLALYHDDLTGLYNYRYLDVVLESEIRRSQRFHQPFCVLFIDIDNFKNINDTHGHLVGSKIIKDVGQALKLQLREVDTIIRYGGDEFVIILLGATGESGKFAAERICKQMAKTVFKSYKESTIRLTISIGVAAFPEHSKEKQSLLNIADECMYQGKRNGKNQVQVFTNDQREEKVPS